MFKLPNCLISIWNVIVYFILRDRITFNAYPVFSVFLEKILYTGVIDSILNFSKLFYTISLSIQLGIYKKYDKKFNEAFTELKNKKKEQTQKTNKAV